MGVSRLLDSDNPDLNDWLTDIVNYGEQEERQSSQKAVRKSVCKVCKDRDPGPIDFTYDVCKECNSNWRLGL